jgi:hypothetical protein
MMSYIVLTRDAAYMENVLKNNWALVSDNDEVILIRRADKLEKIKFGNISGYHAQFKDEVLAHQTSARGFIRKEKGEVFRQIKLTCDKVMGMNQLSFIPLIY